MTLPVSFPLTMSQIANELGLALPLSLNHPWIIELAGKSALPVSFSDLLGKTGRFDGALVCAGTFPAISFNQAPFFGGTLNGAVEQFSPAVTQLTFINAPNWAGNILLRNNTTGASVTLARISTLTWSVNGAATTLRSGFTDSFTVLPSN